jgi:hypothetical protein
MVLIPELHWCLEIDWLSLDAIGEVEQDVEGEGSVVGHAWPISSFELRFFVTVFTWVA